jgi:hypothetical protein
MTLDRAVPVCTNVEDAKLAGFYWWKNTPFFEKVMQNHKDTCGWLKIGEYKVRETVDAGFDTVFCLENNGACSWFFRPKGGDFYAPHKKLGIR